MADPQRDPQPDDARPAGAPEDTASAYAPPGRRQGFWRNPFMVAAMAIVVVALVVYIAFLVG